MRRKWLLLSIVLSWTLCVSYIAYAVEYTPWIELYHVQGPASVQVVAKTGKAIGLQMGYLSSSTVWPWLIEDSDGRFVRFDIYVDMDEYQELSISQRSFILNHKECEITLDFNEKRCIGWRDLKAVSRPLTADSIGSLLLIVIGFAALYAIVCFFVFRSARKKGTPVPRKTGIGWLLIGAWFLSSILDDLTNHHDQH